MSTAPTPMAFTGWGRAAPSVATLACPTDRDALARVLTDAARTGRKVIPRGLGRAYGDAAQCAGGVVVETRALDRILEIDEAAPEPTARLHAGLSLDALLRVLVPRGLFVPVTPGTRYVSVGGAIAADVHGKNHHRDGSLGAHLTGLVLASPSGRHVVSPTLDPALFSATTGGMGLTGVVEEATIRLTRIETAQMRVDTERATDLDDCMARMAARDDGYRYSVAWIDCLGRGRHLGRSVLTRGDHARRDDLPARTTDPLRFDPRVRLTVPLPPPSGLLNPFTVAAFNEAWFRRAPKQRSGELQSIAAFFHPLDGIARWNLLYGRRGFTQYQFVVPFGAEDTVREVLERLGSARVASFLAVLKRFGPAGAGPLSFPIPGWTLALDLPLGHPELAELLDRLDELVVRAGGRVYLAKDGRLKKELLAAMYPRLAEWELVRARVDPDGVLASDLGRRLGLAS